MTENTSILDSYKNSFKSSLGTYTYLLLNQKIPEIFAISTNTDNESPVYKELTEILENSQSLDEIIKKVEKISEIDFSKVVHEENKVDKETVLKTIR